MMSDIHRDGATVTQAEQGRITLDTQWLTHTISDVRSKLLMVHPAAQTLSFGGFLTARQSPDVFIRQNCTPALWLCRCLGIH
jgi:hypothetical protein